MTNFIAQSITLLFDVKQDRLQLVFVNEDGHQLLGQLTRMLLKQLMATMPSWINTHLHDQALASPTEDQRAISQFYHQAAQENVAVQQNVLEIAVNQAPLLISTVNVSKLQQQTAQQSADMVLLEFIVDEDINRVQLALTAEQLHKLIGEMIIKVPDWDIANPWDEKDTNNPQKSSTMVH